MPLPWTQKEKKSLKPTRTFGVPVAPTKRNIKNLVRTKGRPYERSLKALEAGVSIDVEPELRALRAAAYGVVETPTPSAVAAASIEELAVAERMFASLGYDTTLTSVVAFERGAADAVRMRLRALHYGLAARPNWSECVFVTTERTPNRLNVHRWTPLRHVLSAASEEEYRAARDVAAEGWDSVHDDERAFVAYAFPDEPWGEELLRNTAPAMVRGARGGMPSQVGRLGFLLSTCRDAEVVGDYCANNGAYWVSDTALELVHLLPSEECATLLMEALPPTLVKKKHTTFLKTPPRNILRALCKIDDARVPPFVASFVGHKVLGAMAALYFQDCPESRGALEGGNAEALRLLETFGAASASVQEAPPGAVPALLRRRAWRAPKSTKRPKAVAGLSIQPSQPEAVLASAKAKRESQPLAGEALDAWRKDIANGRASVDFEYDYQSRTYFAPPKDEALTAWNEGRGWISYGPLAFIATHGVACIPGFGAKGRLGFLDYEGAEEWVVALESLDSAHIAPTWARIFVGRKRWRRRARRWLRSNPVRAAEGLVPVALGAKGAEQKAAEAALRSLVSGGHVEAVRAAAEVHGKEAVAAMKLFLSRDPLIIDAKAPKLPAFLRIDQLPPLVLVAGGRLDAESRSAMVEMLSVADAGYAGHAILRGEFTAESLDAFVLALFESWARQGGPGRSDWMLRAAVAYQCKATTRAVCMQARAWARSKGAAAARACAALADIGSDAAALHLAHIAATTRFVSLRKEAASYLDIIAGERGLTRDELGDRCVPDLGLDARGHLDVSFADMRLTATLDEGLGVVLLQDDARVRSFPRAAKSTAAEQKKAKAKYDDFKKDVAAIADRQIRRLERAMVLRRTWALTSARRYHFEHPLTQHIARGLVWLTADGTSFRVTRDGTFADAADDLLTLPSDAVVRIAHPLELEDGETWASVFSDYEIRQCFEQLGRRCFALTPDEKAARRVTRYAGRKVRAAKALGRLESRGWRRQEDSMVGTLLRSGGGDVVFSQSFTPAVEIAYLRSKDETEVNALEWSSPAGEVPDAISASEVLADLDGLCE